jgi:hypothetical protein
MDIGTVLAGKAQAPYGSPRYCTLAHNRRPSFHRFHGTIRVRADESLQIFKIRRRFDEQEDVPMTSWKKSTYSSESFNCVEVSISSDRVFVRDSKSPGGTILTCPAEAWQAFISQVRTGSFDLPAAH